ncbi:MAG: tRNA preQ1(34) S-adenosylmethionine ribosyltransferase-isomerase QueA [Phycisphaeraceae bacterium]|nr:tRNA preQ1(34) S-adenosylmethionine ribosyltransferase-isomerase QueA [Phycisphaeraceae bacterium]
MLRTSELEYELPEDRIAVEPASPRDSARLMAVSRASGAIVEHAAVRDLAKFLRAGDVLVFNTTKVVPARLMGKREDTGGAVEGLFLSRELDGSGERWTALLRAKKVRPGMRFALEDRLGQSSGVVLEAIAPVEGEAGAWVVSVENPSGGDALERAGHTPLPPYILKAREHAHLQGDEKADRARYQTVYADRPGSVAAPTAGLHFTVPLLAELERIGVERVDVTLHVGTGTFRPVEVSVVEQHPMHSEWCSASRESVRRVVQAKGEQRRVIAVGTTSARTLESFGAVFQSLRGSGVSESEAIERLPDHLETSLLVTPGYEWRWVSGMMTNFHLPRSTLLAMVGAFLPGEGLSTLRGLYSTAIRDGYRFYSYGDAMLIL